MQEQVPREAKYSFGLVKREQKKKAGKEREQRKRAQKDVNTYFSTLLFASRFDGGFGAVD